MKPGSLIRQRKVRIYGTDPSMHLEYSPDRERSKKFKKAFVMLYLGQELLHIYDKGKKVAAELNPTRALNALGWYSMDQLEEAKAPKAFRKRLDAVAAKEK